ncbi:MAG: hypothetical protein PVI25_07280, partial [Gammaproteobacteria bacterium]
RQLRLALGNERLDKQRLTFERFDHTVTAVFPAGVRVSVSHAKSGNGTEKRSGQFSFVPQQ